MGTTPLRQFLQGLCHNSCWNYAVFWKLQKQNEMLLTWEDGCYDHLKLRGSMESILDDILFDESNEIFSLNWGSSRHDGHSSEYPIGQVVADLASVQYPWGEGVVGEVAYSGNHCWVLCDNISAGKFASKVVHEWPDEWLLQFAAGIKTIVLVPVVPHGVFQLGSLEKVAEYPALVAYIRDKFNAYQNGMDLLPSISRDFLAQTSSSLMPVDMDNLDESSATIVNQIKSENPMAVYSVKPTNNILSTTNQMMPVCLVQDACHIFGKDVLDILNSTRESKINVAMGLIEVSQPVNQSLNDVESQIIEGSLGEFSSLDEELQSFSYSDNYNVSLFGEHANLTMDSYPDGSMMEQPCVDKDADNSGHENLNSFISFPMDSELREALPAFLEQTKEYLWDSSLSGEDACTSSNRTFKKDSTHGIEPSTWESSGWFVNGDEAQHLLNAVVASMHGSLNNSSNKPNDVKFSLTSSGHFAASNKSQSQPEESAFVEGKRVPWSSLTSESVARGKNAIIESPPSSSFESMTSALIEQKQQKKAYGYLQVRKGSKLSNASKRRARPGENQRPRRPRDRQLIQDRVKELRELVPNGSKCSIDGLLDRTINHMLFLRSVTDRADKLRQCVHQEVTGRKNMKSSGSKGHCQSGKSWAFELGSDFQVCPIVVEDLEYPGHMLIEMLCNDHGLFMEISEVIHGLELTILKGVMESRSNNTWAHFIVEASRGFHRLDIFWPLMQLLQHNQCPISSKI